MRTVLLSVSLLFATTLSGWAVKVSGVVKDAGGALPGASVTVKGSKTGTETDDDGKFDLDVKPGSVLVVEFLGYEKKEITVPKNPKKLTINMSEDVQLTGTVEVVAQPYGGTGGTTGATTTLGADALKANTSASIDNALQGKVAGMAVQSTSGQPGAPATMRIHGVSSLTGSGDPLYVVDGMPLGGGTDKSASSNPLASINPSDIESMEVLKDASATAIYGSRAANGVVIIKTKKGSANNAPKISYNGNFTVSQFTKRIDMMNLKEYATYVNNQQIINDRQNQPDALMTNPSVLGEGTDWQDELFQTAIGHSHQLSVNGGDANTQYNASLGYMNQEGVILSSEYERINGRMSIESQIKPWLRMGMNVGISRQNSKKVANIIDTKAKQSGATCVTFKETDENVILQTLMQLPSDSPYDLDGSVSGPETDQGVKMNPIATLNNSPITRHETNILGSTFLEFKLSQDITWRNEFGIDMTNADDQYYQPSYDYGGLSKAADQASLDKGNYSNSSMRFSSYANYNHTFAKAHKVNVMVGAEANEYEWEGQVMNWLGFSSNAVHTPNLASSSSLSSYYKGAGSMASFFGRVNYSYKSRYDLTATGRYDGSSNFASGNQWGFFPSVGLAWRISQEDFIAKNDNVSKVINNMKLRAGYGETGNSNCSPSHIAYVSKWTTTNGSYDMFKYNNYINKDLSWETNKQYNLGLNLGLWNRIDFVFDAFYKKNEDLLLKPELPAYVAPTDGGWEYLNTAYVNAGSIKNVGFDIALNTTNIQDSLCGQPFAWTSNISFSVVRNEVVDLGSSTEAITESSDPSGVYRMFSTNIEINRSVKGEAPGRFYGYKTNGLIQNTADLLAYEASTGRTANVGDVKYAAEKSFIGDPNPDFTWGFGNTVNWGPWSLGVQLSGSYGNDVYNLVRQRLEAQTDKWVNQSADCLNFARVVTATNADGSAIIMADGSVGQKIENSSTSIPRSEYTNDSNGNGKTVSDRYVEDGSFVKIQNINLTYTLPSKYCEKMKISNLHVTAGCSNVYTFTGYEGYDPENPGSAIRQGVDEGRYPSPRTYSLGLGFNF